MNTNQHETTMTTPIIWHPESERPKVHDKPLWVLTRHWKGRIPHSYEIFAGEYCEGRSGVWCVTNYDDIGQGGISWEPESQSHSGDDTFVAWAYYEEGHLPQFVTNPEIPSTELKP